MPALACKLLQGLTLPTSLTLALSFFLTKFRFLYMAFPFCNFNAPSSLLTWFLFIFYFLLPGMFFSSRFKPQLKYCFLQVAFAVQSKVYLLHVILLFISVLPRVIFSQHCIYFSMNSQWNSSTASSPLSHSCLHILTGLQTLSKTSPVGQSDYMTELQKCL